MKAERTHVDGALVPALRIAHGEDEFGVGICGEKLAWGRSQH